MYHCCLTILYHNKSCIATESLYINDKIKAK